MIVETRTSLEFPHPTPVVFERAVALATLPRTFRGFGPIPAILRVSVEGGGPIVVGAVRLIEASDKSTMRELVTAHEPPWLHAYGLEGIAPPLSLLVRRGESEWRFEDINDGRGTRMTWTYRFHLTTPLVFPLTFPLLKIFMHGALRRCLENLRAELS
jgi:hypothetical protein